LKKCSETENERDERGDEDEGINWSDSEVSFSLYVHFLKK
jgi:hypothetical protein